MVHLPQLECSSDIRCHHRLKTFHDGWRDEQLPDGTGNRLPVNTANKLGRGCFSLRGCRQQVATLSKNMARRII